MNKLEKVRYSKFEWNEEFEETFNWIKELITLKLSLYTPNFNKSFFIACDASDIAISAVLFQVEDQTIRIVSFESRSLKNSEIFYTIPRLEMFSLYYFLDYYRKYLQDLCGELSRERASMPHRGRGAGNRQRGTYGGTRLGL